MTSYFGQVLFSVYPMAPLLEKSRLCPGHSTPESIMSWPCLACHMVFKRYNTYGALLSMPYGSTSPVMWCLKHTTNSCFFLSVLYYFWIPTINWTCRASNSPAAYSFAVMIWKKETTNRRNVNRQYGSVAAIWCKFLPYILWLSLFQGISILPHFFQPRSW